MCIRLKRVLSRFHLFWSINDHQWTVLSTTLSGCVWYSSWASCRGRMSPSLEFLRRFAGMYGHPVHLRVKRMWGKTAQIFGFLPQKRLVSDLCWMSRVHQSKKLLRLTPSLLDSIQESPRCVQVPNKSVPFFQTSPDGCWRWWCWVTSCVFQFPTWLKNHSDFIPRWVLGLGDGEPWLNHVKSPPKAELSGERMQHPHQWLISRHQRLIRPLLLFSF